MDEEVESIKARYESLASDRQAYETRAENNAMVTVPSLFMDVSSTGQTNVETNEVQSLGGSGVKSLASKLVLSLMPPEGRFFRIRPHSGAMNELTGGDSNGKAEAISILSQGEEDVLSAIQQQDIRDSFFTLIQYLMVAGNVLIEKKKDDGIKIHTLRNYVVRRSSKGKAVEIIFVELIHRSDLPEGIDDIENEEVELYTRVYLEDKKWIERQEINGEAVGSEITYAEDKVPYKAQVWELLPDEDYGRGYIDNHYGDLVQYQKCIRMLVEGGIGSAKTVWAVNPLGSTRKKDVANAANLDIIDGKADDVQAIQTGKIYDYSQISQLVGDYRITLGRAFLDTGASRRDAERVTAEEIQMMIRELETVLAGAFTHFASNLLKPIVEWVIDEIGLEVGEGTEINIVVGADALSKSREVDKLSQFIQMVHALKYQDYINEGEVVQRLANGIGINTVDLVLTPNDVKAKREASAAAAQAQQAGMAQGQAAGETAGTPQQGVQ